MILIFISCTQGRYIWPFVAFIHKHFPHTHFHKNFDTRHRARQAINYPGPDRIQRGARNQDQNKQTKRTSKQKDRAGSGKGSCRTQRTPRDRQKVSGRGQGSWQKGNVYLQHFCDQKQTINVTVELGQRQRQAGRLAAPGR